MHTERFLFPTSLCSGSDAEVAQATDRLRDVGPELSRELNVRIPRLHAETVATLRGTRGTDSEGTSPR